MVNSGEVSEPVSRSPAPKLSTYPAPRCPGRFPVAGAFPNAVPLPPGVHAP